jgi:tetratricopeptide (TPR) repeat protein
VQIDAILARLQNEANTFLRDLGGKEALRRLRVERTPPAENSWWFLDEWLAQRRRESTRKNLRSLGITAMVLVILAVLYQAFLAPDPALLAQLRHEQSSRDALMTGNFAEALAQVEQAEQYDPQNVELLVLKGVILQLSGKTEQAGPVFNQAEQAAESREYFLLTRGQTYLMAGDLDAAMADVDMVLAENPQSPSGYLLVAQVYENQGEYLRAYDSYQQSSSLANAQEQPEIAALARTRLAYLVQIMNSPMLELTVPPP